jgi:hypothetical protein
MNAADRVYRTLLRAYPADFRAEYANQMALAFRDRRREAGSARVGFWTAMLWDVAKSAPALRVDALRTQWSSDIQPVGTIMKTMAILAMLIGAIEAVNSSIEAWIGGVVNHGGYSLAGGVLGLAAGAALVFAAVALLRRTPGALTFAQSAAVLCLAVFLSVRLLRPMFSVFATLLGIAFPIALLIYVNWTRRGAGSNPRAA